MEKLGTIEEMRSFVRRSRSEGRTIAFVPTMGALHRGHGSCVEVASRLSDLVVTSIFVNPTQFGPSEDLGRYPRPIEQDLSLCDEWGVAAVFMPGVEAIYPDGQAVWVDVGRLGGVLCGRTRAGHFRGVATVVLKLLNIVQPDWAVFGQKDAQQAVVIRAMVDELNVPVRLALSRTVRESDGLALSSRNSYLSAEERALAPWIHKSLLRGFRAVERGERDPSRVALEMRTNLGDHGIEDVEYAEVVRARDLAEPSRLAGKLILAVAARLGSTRLIDNLVLDVSEDGGVEESMLF
jgi:pantoate--beta-alanine ligase